MLHNFPLRKCPTSCQLVEGSRKQPLSAVRDKLAACRTNTLQRFTAIEKSRIVFGLAAGGVWRPLAHALTLLAKLAASVNVGLLLCPSFLEHLNDLIVIWFLFCQHQCRPAFAVFCIHLGSLIYQNLRYIR